MHVFRHPVSEVHFENLSERPWRRDMFPENMITGMDQPTCIDLTSTRSMLRSAIMEQVSLKPDISPPETWVKRYGDYLYRYALSRLRDPENAADCVQDTLLAGIKNFHKFDGSRDVKYWLRGIMRNKIVDQFRKNRKERHVDLGIDESILESALFRFSGIGELFPQEWKFDPRNCFDRFEFWEVFQQCVDQLKDPVRQAFVLHMLEDHDTKETCKIMNIQPNYLWVLLHRARSQLRSLLEKHWDNPRNIK